MPIRPVRRNMCSELGTVRFAIYSCTHGIYISRTVWSLTREMHRRVYLLFLSPKERPCSSYGACLRMMKMVFLKRLKLFNARYALRIRGSFQLLHRLSIFVAQQLFLCWIYSAEGFLVKLLAASCAMTTSTHLCNVYPFAFTEFFRHSPDIPRMNFLLSEVDKEESTSLRANPWDLGGQG